MSDEHSLGRAPILVQEIFHIVKKINEKNVTILLVEQNVSQALAMCDRAYPWKTEGSSCREPLWST